MWKRARLAFVAPARPPPPAAGAGAEEAGPAAALSTEDKLDPEPSLAPPDASSTRASTAAVVTATAAAAGAVAAIAAAALMVPPRRLRGSTTRSGCCDGATAAPLASFSFPPLPEPQPGDLVAWLPPPSLLLQQQQQQQAQDETDDDVLPSPLPLLPPAVALDPPPSFWEQALMLSRYAPRLSTATKGAQNGGGGAPSYAAAVPQAVLGVVAYDGKWLFHSGGEEGMSGEEGSTVYLADAPLCRTTQGALLVLRAAVGGGATPEVILGRALAYKGAAYEVLEHEEHEEEDGDEGGVYTNPVFPLLARAAGREANARYACWVTSVAGAHLRTPIERGPLYHHAVDTGEGTVVHYSGGEVRLDHILVLLAGKEGLAPHRLATVNGARLSRATENEVLRCLARLTSRLGERRYCVLTNNCESLSAWATTNRPPPPFTASRRRRPGRRWFNAAPTAADEDEDDPLPPLSGQVQAASLAVGSVVGGVGAIVVGAATVPVFALPMMAVTGAAIGSMVTHSALARVAGAAQRELRALQQVAVVCCAAGREEEGDGGFVLVEAEAEAEASVVAAAAGE